MFRQHHHPVAAVAHEIDLRHAAEDRHAVGVMLGPQLERLLHALDHRRRFDERRRVGVFLVLVGVVLVLPCGWHEDFVELITVNIQC